MKALFHVRSFVSVLIILIFAAVSMDGVPSYAQESTSEEKTYDAGKSEPFSGVAIIGQNFTAIPVNDAAVTFCCDGCSSVSGGASCTGCTGGGGPVTCPSDTIRVTCRDDMAGCPVE